MQFETLTRNSALAWRRCNCLQRSWKGVNGCVIVTLMCIFSPSLHSFPPSCTQVAAVTLAGAVVFWVVSSLWVALMGSGGDPWTDKDTGLRVTQLVVYPIKCVIPCCE